MNAKKALVGTPMLLALLGLAGCGVGSGAAADEPGKGAAAAVECLVAYRSGAAGGSEQTLVLSEEARQQTLAFDDLVFHARYWPVSEAPGEHGLRVWGTTTSDIEAELVGHLFQLPTAEPVRNQFRGDHGFTGLSYIYHPTSRAEIQYTCKAR